MLLQIYKSDSVGQKFCETRNHSKALDQVENGLNNFVVAASGDGGQMSGEHPQVRGGQGGLARPLQISWALQCGPLLL